MNRAVGRMKMLRKDGDFEAFERIIQEAHALHPIRILDYCLMSSHWHFVVWPAEDGEVSDFFRWLAHTHAMRWRVSHHTVGFGPLYQGRFKNFPVQGDGHLLTLCRYVERNPVAAGMVERAEQWRWGSLWVRRNGEAKQQSILSAWPVDQPRNWVEMVNRPLGEDESELIQTSIKRSRPLGSEQWMRRIISRLHLEHTVRGEGRPGKRVGRNKRN